MTLQGQITALEEKMTQIEDSMRFLFAKLDELTVLFRESDARSKSGRGVFRTKNSVS